MSRKSIDGNVRRRLKRSAGVAVLAAVLAGGAATAPAQADFQIGVYGGWSKTFDDDMSFNQPNGTNLTLHDLSFDDDSFTFDGGPPYYGLRAIYWRDSNWGFMVDYTHSKVNPDLNQVATITGTRDGVPVSGQQPLSNTVSLLEFTDGLNLLTFNVLYRTDRGRYRPYGGVGVGLSIPNVEFRRANGGPETNEYQITGVAVAGLVGLEMDINDRFALFGEYKLTFSQNEADLNGGGTLEADLWTNHVIFGVAYKFGAHRAADSYK
ncbi:MAG: lipid A oxidase [Alphaproteobacteria bacterium]|nr:MAG: lipid A oxidase [Alphaproteobacteria bacterium]